MGAVLAGTQAWYGVAKAKGGDAPEFGVVEVQSTMLSGGSEDGSVSLSSRGEEAGLLVRW